LGFCKERGEKTKLRDGKRTGKKNHKRAGGGFWGTKKVGTRRRAERYEKKARQNMERKRPHEIVEAWGMIAA